ncbi:tpsp [Symbiodinium natans]|uniref:Tpsp protein n=1 Tax=Symbiodinium natans TaxID=878477 RepID=A0A812J275_9DINO|nr:tpsp [Symbiodinium natans]
MMSTYIGTKCVGAQVGQLQVCEAASNGGCGTSSSSTTTTLSRTTTSPSSPPVQSPLLHGFSDQEFLEGGVELSPTKAESSEEFLPLSTQPLSWLDSDSALERFWPFDSTSPKALFLDYDGTLREFESSPELAVPTQEVMSLLKALDSRPDFRPHIISGRGSEFLEAHFGSLNTFTLIAEHGYHISPPLADGRDGECRKWELWEHFGGDAKHFTEHKNWKATLREAMSRLADQHAGSRLEEKQSSLVWHYRQLADEATADTAVAKAWEDLQQLCKRERLQDINLSKGHKVLEASYRNVRKGLVMRRLCEEKALFGKPYSAVLAAGDDVSDETMFEAAPRDFLTIKVGAGSTTASLRQKLTVTVHLEFQVKQDVSHSGAESPEELRQFLWRLVFEPHISKIDGDPQNKAGPAATCSNILDLQGPAGDEPSSQLGLMELQTTSTAQTPVSGAHTKQMLNMSIICLRSASSEDIDCDAGVSHAAAWSLVPERSCRALFVWLTISGAPREITKQSGTLRNGNLDSKGLQAVRLSSLLRGFGLCPVEISKQESKSAISVLKAAYRDKAKEQHPDLAPRERQAEAEKNFVKLSTEFDEALKLLEAGVLPVARAPTATADLNLGLRNGTSQAAWHPHFTSPEWRAVNRQFTHSEQPKFDTYTRVKGHLIVWSGAFIFLTCLREFLVGFAGGTWAWHPPKDLNPFWVRRYDGAWSDKDKQEKGEPQSPPGRPQPVKSEKVRPVSDFYAKRHVSKVRKKYSPRGHGPSL